MPPPSICAPLTLCPPSFRIMQTGFIIGETSLFIENAKTHNPFPFSVSHSQLRFISLHPLFPHYRFQTPGLDDYAPLLLLHIAQTRPTTIIHRISTTRTRVTTSKSPSPGDVALCAHTSVSIPGVPGTRTARIIDIHKRPDLINPRTPLPGYSPIHPSNQSSHPRYIGQRRPSLYFTPDTSTILPVHIHRSRPPRR